MGVITIREFSANAERAIARVEAGETLDIVRDGRSVAELRPKKRVHVPVRDPQWHARLAELSALLNSGMDLGIDKVTYEDKYGDDPR